MRRFLKCVQSFRFIPIFLVLLTLTLVVLGCAGKRLSPLSNNYYFIPRPERALYVNETVNLTRNFKIGDTLTTALRNYYANHHTLRGVRYKEADLILTVYLVGYRVERSKQLDFYGQNELFAEIDLEISVLKKKKPSTLAQPPLDSDKSYTYLKRKSIFIKAHSEEALNEPSSISNVETLLFIKTIQVLDYFFKTGRIPSSVSTK